ncbi:hypothetical protein [Roseateles paludis]|jgi:hypothetical protein|uniref:Uncharacterized protein n=1 Tax=Roseateles paludis TaxID=3145238 RepID=A0ABV0G1R0_9BURK
MAEKLNPDGWLDLRLYHAVFVEHITSDIKFCLENKRMVAGAQLLMSAIDVASGIERPRDKLDTTRDDFISWADRYLTLSGPEYTLRGVDLYAARCGLLHGYTAQAKLISQGKAVMLGWLDDMMPPVRANEDQSLVLASLAALFVAFNHGLADSISRINRNEELAALVNERMAFMFQASELDADLKTSLRQTAEDWRETLRANETLAK